MEEERADDGAGGYARRDIVLDALAREKKRIETKKSTAPLYPLPNPNQNENKL